MGGGILLNSATLGPQGLGFGRGVEAAPPQPAPSGVGIVC